MFGQRSNDSNDEKKCVSELQLNKQQAQTLMITTIFAERESGKAAISRYRRRGFILSGLKGSLQRLRQIRRQMREIGNKDL
jgi:hypothetical protein